MGDKWLQHRSSKLRVPSITYDSVHCLTSWTSQILALKTYPKLYRRANRDQNVRNFAGKTRGRTASAAVEKHRVKVSENMGAEFKRGGGVKASRLSTSLPRRRRIPSLSLSEETFPGQSLNPKRTAAELQPRPSPHGACHRAGSRIYLWYSYFSVPRTGFPPSAAG